MINIKPLVITVTNSFRLLDTKLGDIFFYIMFFWVLFYIVIKKSENFNKKISLLLSFIVSIITSIAIISLNIVSKINQYNHYLVLIFIIILSTYAIVKSENKIKAIITILLMVIGLIFVINSGILATMDFLISSTFIYMGLLAVFFITVKKYVLRD